MSTSKDQIRTVWKAYEYEVWGSTEFGWTMNNRFCVADNKRLYLKKEIRNPGTEHEFVFATPSDSQIKRIFGIDKDEAIFTFGDDLLIFVERASDKYPYGEMYCISHDSLSPVHKKVKDALIQSR